MLGGDFNEILYNDEKIGGNLRGFNQLNAFYETVSSHNLSSLKAKGSPFTWDNKRTHPYNILARLDRFLANSTWLTLHPGHQAFNLDLLDSDHRPILLDTKPPRATNDRSSHRLKAFTFEHNWLMEEDYEDVLKQG